jgi:hypothetical protein
MISIDGERSRVLSEMKGFLGEHLGPEEASKPDGSHEPVHANTEVFTQMKHAARFA